MNGSAPRGTPATCYGAAPIPVENTGGAGTADSHWRESVYGREIMTGFLNGAADPVSLVSVFGLKDLGYVVNPAAAEPLGPPRPSTGPRTSRAPAGALELRDVPIRPTFVASPDGTLRRIPGGAP